MLAAAGTALAIVFGLASACSTRRAARRLASVATPSDTLAFVRYARGSYAIFVMSVRGGPARRLSPAPGHAFPPPRELFQDTPSWSPDGTRIAFASDRAGPYGVYVMRSDGTHSRRILVSKVGDAAPSWSPDGREIVFSRGTSGIYVMRADGTKVRRLTHALFATDTDPAWSPDGTRIAFVRKQGGGSAVFVVRPDGKGLCEVTPLEASTVSPAWSPDGAMLAYSAGTGVGSGSLS